MSFNRHWEIYPSDEDASMTSVPAHSLDEFPVGYSLAGCAPALPASASPPDQAMALEKAGVDLDKKLVRITKSKTKKGLRCLKLTAESWQILSRRMGDESKWIFPTTRRSGQHITKLNCPHDRALAKLDMNFVLYNLRHTFATRMIEAGIDCQL